MNIETPSKNYKADKNVIYSCQYHVIFCPKYRRPVLEEPIQQRLKELILEKQSSYKYNIIELETMPNHVHILIDVNPKLGVHKCISKIKGYTSNILRKEFPQLITKLPTLWTRSCFISTVGTVSLEVVKKYIKDQKGK